MNPVALLHNIHYSLRVCPSWSARLNRLLWLYSNKRFVKPWSTANRQISFRYAPPVNSVEVFVRDNKGSDAFIFSEVFDHRYYDFPLPFQPATVLDLGANAGFTAIFLVVSIHLLKLPVLSQCQIMWNFSKRILI